MMKLPKMLAVAALGLATLVPSLAFARDFDRDDMAYRPAPVVYETARVYRPRFYRQERFRPEYGRRSFHGRSRVER